MTKLNSLILLPLMALSFSFTEANCNTPIGQNKGPSVPKPMDPVVTVDLISPRFVNKPRGVSGNGFFEASDRLVLKAAIKGVIDKALLNEGDQVRIDDTVCIFRGEEFGNLVSGKQNEIKGVQSELDAYHLMLQNFNTPSTTNPNLEPVFLDEEQPSKVVPPKPMGILNPQPVQSRAELEAKLGILETRLETLTKELTTLEESLKSLNVKATIQGIITKRHITDGSIVEAGEPLYEIVNLDPITLTFYVPQDVTSYVDKNIKVIASPTSAPELKTEGLIYFISPALDPVKRMLELKAHLPNEKGLIREGQEGIATIITRRMDQVWVIPKKSIVTYEGKNYVYVQTGNQARKTEVTIGETSGTTEVMVDANFRIDDLIVTSNLDAISDGSFIKTAPTQGQK